MGRIAPSYTATSIPSQTWFLEHIRVSPTNGISIGSVIFAGHIHATNIQTDRHTDTQT